MFNIFGANVKHMGLQRREKQRENSPQFQCIISIFTLQKFFGPPKPHQGMPKAMHMLSLLKKITPTPSPDIAKAHFFRGKSFVLGNLWYQLKLRVY